MHRQYKQIYPAFGYHPEQVLPGADELSKILEFIDCHKDSMIAVGEVGLPYYLSRQQENFELKPYIEMLEVFIEKAVQVNKPLVLHAVYEDADRVCDLLEKYHCQKAHFHWFKGSLETQARMIEKGYYISMTPDLLYKEKIQQLAQNYPLSLMMVESDGPWPLEGPFKDQINQPQLIHQTIKKLADLKGRDIQSVYSILKENTEKFYQI